MEKQIQELILSEIREIRSAQGDSSKQLTDLDKRLALHIQKMDHDIAAIQSLDAVQNEQLILHIEGVNTLKAMYATMKSHTDARIETVETRIKTLEAPSRRWAAVRRKIKSISVWAKIWSTIIIAVAATVAFFEEIYNFIGKIFR